MTAPGPGDDPFAPPVPGQVPPHRPYQPPPRSTWVEVMLKVLAGLAILTVIGFTVFAAFFVWAISSYGDNK